jgi:predicted acetyltransferase
MKLVEPTIKYKKSFISALLEYQKEKETSIHFRNEHYNGLKKEDLGKNFSEYIKKLLDESKGKNLPKGYVPQSTYWLIDKGEFIGRGSVRHNMTDFLLREGGLIGYDIRPSKRKMGYGKEILKLILVKAKKLGLKEVLVSCDENNIGSRKIIESNGGILENKLNTQNGKGIKLRYWISVSLE